MISVANIAEDLQEYFCVEKVVSKEVTGGNPGLHRILTSN